IDLCKRHNLNVIEVDSEWGEGVPMEKFAAILAADKDREIKAVLATHNETATGVRSDIGAVRALLDECSHPAMLYVDGISSIAAMDFRMDEWGVDLAICGSQKGFMLPTGLAILAASQKALNARHEAKCPRCFFDLGDMLASNAAGSFHYTPSTQMLHGLREALDMLLEEGLENVFARHHRVAEGVRRAAAAWGLSLCAKRPDEYSDTVTAIRVPDGFDGAEFCRHAYERYGVSFGGGLGDVAGKVFRIGHLGSVSDVVTLSGIATAEMVMHDLGYPIALGSGVAAAQAWYCETPAAEIKAA
ncbi:MAG: aminotransferase class V-fold PLP-dependent enzyme, partial [Pseudomonadota bacterium]